MVAEVIIDTSVKKLNKTFDYEIPTDLDIKVGSRVFVPFGKQKELAEGIVVNIKNTGGIRITQIKVFVIAVVNTEIFCKSIRFQIKGI